MTEAPGIQPVKHNALSNVFQRTRVGCRSRCPPPVAAPVPAQFRFLPSPAIPRWWCRRCSPCCRYGLRITQRKWRQKYISTYKVGKKWKFKTSQHDWQGSGSGVLYIFSFLLKWKSLNLIWKWRMLSWQSRPRAGSGEATKRVAIVAQVTSLHKDTFLEENQPRKL